MTGDLCVNWTTGNNVGDRDADHENWCGPSTRWRNGTSRRLWPGHGRLGTVETLRGQRAYLHDMLSQVGAGIKAGRSADQLANEIDLSRHQPFGAGRMEMRARFARCTGGSSPWAPAEIR